MSRIEDLVQQWYVTKDAHHQIYRQNCQRWALPHTLHDKAVWLRQEPLALGLSLQAESRLLARAAALLETCDAAAAADETVPVSRNEAFLQHVAIAQSASAAAFDAVDGTAPDKETP